MHLSKITLSPEKFPVRNVYPFSIPLFSGTSKIMLDKPVTFFVGENGSGKSTLLKALARRCSIHIWDEPERSRCVVNRYEEELHRYIDVEWADEPVPGSFFASEVFHHFAKNVDEWASMSPGILKYYGNKSLLVQSHGQYHMSYFVNRYGIKGLYLLDEPENALSPASQIRLLKVLADTSRAGHAQFIIATHSPILLAYPDAEILSFDAVPIRTIQYKETSHYRIYRDVITDWNEYFKEQKII